MPLKISRETRIVPVQLRHVRKAVPVTFTIMPLPNPKSGISAGFVYFREKKHRGIGIIPEKYIEKKRDLYTIVILLVVKSPPLWGIYGCGEPP